MASNKLLSVALDFGTSFSGYAFSFKHDKETIITSKWTGTDYSKAPTSILFNPQKDFDSFGFEAEDNYALLSKNGSQREWYLFKQFKLVLIKEKKLKRDTTICDVSGKEMLAMHVISAAITFLKNDFLENCRLRFPTLRETDIQWVLTVPAIWNDSAKQFMRLAANQAGLPDESLMLVLEPDAAAMSASCFTLCEEGEKYMILDCGGGTVDVSVVMKTSRGSMNCIFRPTGGVWGGTQVDDAFHEYLIAQFGVNRYTCMEKHEILQVQRSFENAKKKAQKPDTRKVGIWLPLTVRNDISSLQIRNKVVGDKLFLSVDEVVQLFIKPVNSIVSHLEEIINDTEMNDLRHIIMVGGFSESEILQSAIQNNYPQINVLVVNDPGSAILKGATVLGHNPNIIEIRRSTYTYGIAKYTKFVERYHDWKKLKVIDGKSKCKDIFDKFITVDEVIEINKTRVKKRYYPVYFGQTSMRLAVHRSTYKDPCYVTDLGCEKIGDLVIKMPDLTGEKKRRVKVSILFGETELRVEAVDKTTGKIYTAAFDFLGR
ncbi:hypothetical protein ACJMK2_028134 [Sinanodonta woodiana]|uniref:Heat shock 70 kDa protein 12A n=1 Tax=Sinanodonta woodiana TaxID=1069815 RepID=A0ABD3X9R0_SINWO